MKNNLASLLSATGAAVLATLGAAPLMADQGAMDKPAGMATASMTRTATVTQIDPKDRWITLKLADGSVIDIQAGPEVKNFAQIRVGDLVTAKHEETLAVEVVPAGQAPPNVSGGTSIVTAPPGTKPLGVRVDKTMVSGRVTDIDYDKRSVTLKGPAGNTRTIGVGPSVERFNAIQKGDDVVLTLKSATMIEVTTPGKKTQ